MEFEQIYNNIINKSLDTIIPTLPKFLAKQSFQFAIMNNQIRERYSGSIGNLHALQQIQEVLQEHEIDYYIDSFVQNTPVGKIKFNNLVVDFSSKATEYIIIGAHHDTKYLPQFKNFSGANDGSSGVGLILGLILYFKQLQLKLPIGLKFILFDGQECFYNYTNTDGLVGSKYAAKIYNKKCLYMILADMIGSTDLNIQFPANSNKDLINTAFNIINKLNYSQYFATDLTTNKIIDDTNPFEKYNIPTINFIQMSYNYWHTDEDTIDKISQKSLQITGNVIIELIKTLLNKHK